MTEQSTETQPKLDQWIVFQLRHQVLKDLEGVVPEGYFGQKTISDYAAQGPEAQHLNYEMQWGHNAGSLGRTLTFYTPIGLSARQASASELLMNLGLLAATQAALGISQHLDQLSKQRGTSIENPNLALLPGHISVLESNLTQTLRQYLNYLPPNEQLPFRSLLQSLSVDARLTPETFPTMPVTQNFFGTVGSVQTGSGSVAHIQQQWTSTNQTAVSNALESLTQTIQSTPVTQMPVHLKEQVVKDIIAKLDELKSEQPDKPKLLAWLSKLAAAAGDIEKLKPAFKAVQEIIANSLS